MADFVDAIEAATVDASPEIREKVARLRTAKTKADKEPAARAAYVSQQSTVVPPSIKIELKTSTVTFVSFDPEVNPAKTVALLQAQMTTLRKRPGSRHRAKELKLLEQLTDHFGTIERTEATGKPSNRKDKRIQKRLRRKAARADDRRKVTCESLEECNSPAVE